MSKLRFSTTDVIAMIRDIRGQIIGQRLANIYDLNDKTYLFKFASAGVSEKILLLMESGVRFHTTRYFREKNELPSPFAMKLRRYLRTKRVEDVRQLGVDRVVDFKFGSGEDSCHILLELYAKGNIVLTDAHYTVIALLRSHIFDHTHTPAGLPVPLANTNAEGGGGAADVVCLKVGEVYPMSEIVQAHTLTSNADPQATLHSRDVFMDAAAPGGINLGESGCDYDAFVQWAQAKAAEVGGLDSVNSAHAQPQSQQQSELAQTTADAAKQNNKSQHQAAAPAGSKKSKPKKLTLRQLLLNKDSGVASLGAEIVDHCCVMASLSPSLKIDSASVAEAVTSQQFAQLVDAFVESKHTLFAQLSKPTLAGASGADGGGYPGYILCKPAPAVTTKAAAPKLGHARRVEDDDREEEANKEATSKQEYEEFVPYIFAQHAQKPFIAFESFDRAVDEYFCKIEEQKLDKQARDIEVAAQKKIDSVRADADNALKHLSEHQRTMELHAQLVEEYADMIDKACLVINSCIATHMSWENIADMVRTQADPRTHNNPIAQMIVKVDLAKNKITVQLENLFANETNTGDAEEGGDGDERIRLDDSDDEDNGANQQQQPASKTKASAAGAGAGGANTTAPTTKKEKLKQKHDKSQNATKQYLVALKPNTVLVDIDLSATAFANASAMFTQRKVAHAKEMKTVEQSMKALQVVESQTSKALGKQNLTRTLRAARKVHWFEKFNWFITTEGYLVLSGRDAQQNEVLVKRYLRDGDAYVHADLAGASSCIVRAKHIPITSSTAQQQPQSQTHSYANIRPVISPLALQEAGCMSVCRSVAWSNKVVTSAWWVHANQVSKTAPTGEYLTTGSFMIYGKKNFLPPSPLEMGFAILFRLADASVGNHKDERKDRMLMGDNANTNLKAETESVYSEAFDRYNLPVTGVNADLIDIIDNEGDEDEDDLLETIEEEQEHEEEETEKAPEEVPAVVDGSIAIVPPAGTVVPVSAVKYRTDGKGRAQFKDRTQVLEPSQKAIDQATTLFASVGEHPTAAVEEHHQRKRSGSDSSSTVSSTSDVSQPKETTTPLTSPRCTSIPEGAEAILPPPGTVVPVSAVKYRTDGKGRAQFKGSTQELMPTQTAVAHALTMFHAADAKHDTIVEITSARRDEPEEPEVSAEEKEEHEEEREAEPEVHQVGFENLKPLRKAAKTLNNPTKSNINSKEPTQSTPKAPSKDKAPTPAAGAADTSKKPTKKLSKRAARKYAEQDDEDRELAMLALGHKKPATGSEKDKEKDKTAGGKGGDGQDMEEVINSYRKLFSGLPAQAQEKLLSLVQEQHLRVGDISTHDAQTLADVAHQEGEADCVSVVKLFVDGCVAQYAAASGGAGAAKDSNKGKQGKDMPKAKSQQQQQQQQGKGKGKKGDAASGLDETGGGGRVANMSGFLSGIVRRFIKDKYSTSSKCSSGAGGGASSKQRGQIKLSPRSPAAPISPESSDETTSKTDKMLQPVMRDIDAAHSQLTDTREMIRNQYPDMQTTDEVLAPVLVDIQAAHEELDEIRQLLEDEGVLAEEEGKAADELEKLTGAPLGDDQLLYAIPVCGPYFSLQGCKYKVKLTPGTLKRGKAFKQAMEVFAAQASASSSNNSGLTAHALMSQSQPGGGGMNNNAAQEKMLLKGIQDTEGVAVLLSDVRLSVAGLQQAKQRMQRGQKKEKKNKAAAKI